MLACVVFCVVLQAKEVDVTSKVIVHNKSWVKLGGFYSLPQIVMGADCTLKSVKLVPRKTLKVTFSVVAAQGLQFQGVKKCEVEFKPSNPSSKGEKLGIQSDDATYVAPEDGEVTLTIPVKSFRLYLKP